jgi:hypothetical protein
MSSTASDDARLTMRTIIRRIATGPALSEDISADEARAGLYAILNGRECP